jgi:hypothetical protein
MAYRADRGYETNLASLLSRIVLRYEKAMMEEKIMINVSLTMEMARNLALFGRDLMFPSRSIHGTYCARDAIAIPLPRKFARDFSLGDWFGVRWRTF